jgi:hypothetical protein
LGKQLNLSKSQLSSVKMTHWAGAQLSRGACAQHVKPWVQETGVSSFPRLRKDGITLATLPNRYLPLGLEKTPLRLETATGVDPFQMQRTTGSPEARGGMRRGSRQVEDWALGTAEKEPLRQGPLGKQSIESLERPEGKHWR